MWRLKINEICLSNSYMGDLADTLRADVSSGYLDVSRSVQVS